MRWAGYARFLYPDFPVGMYVYTACVLLLLLLLSVGGGQPHVRCTAGMYVLSPGIYSFAFCWSYDCLPPRFSNQRFSLLVEQLPIPDGEAATFGLDRLCPRPACLFAHCT